MPGFVHVVDDDAAFRTAIERRLRHAGYEVATYASAAHLLDRLPSDSVLGCILLDVRIPGLSGPEVQDRLSELGSILPIIFLTGYPDIPTTVRGIKAGADDFLTKPVSSGRLLQAVERAIARHDATYRQKNSQDIARSHIASLTPREREVFELVVRGQTNKHAARSLGCTERTIKAHRHRVMEKMQVQSLAELVSLAERVGAPRYQTFTNRIATGLELRHRLKTNGNSVPVIFMTGNDSPAVRMAAHQSGCLVYLTKPFSARSLLEPLERASAY